MNHDGKPEAASDPVGSEESSFLDVHGKRLVAILAQVIAFGAAYLTFPPRVVGFIGIVVALAWMVYLWGTRGYAAKGPNRRDLIVLTVIAILGALVLVGYGFWPRIPDDIIEARRATCEKAAETSTAVNAFLGTMSSSVDDLKKFKDPSWQKVIDKAAAASDSATRSDDVNLKDDTSRLYGDFPSFSL